MAAWTSTPPSPLLTELELHEVEELDREWFEAELGQLLPVA